MSNTASTASAGEVTLSGIGHAYRGKLLVTYALFCLENVLHLLQPLVLGLAINDLLRASYVGLGILVAQHFSHMLVSCLRRAYDTRAFTKIYNDLASRLVEEQRRRQVEVGTVAARSALSREFVEFFEKSVPVIMASLFALAGALVFLAFYDWTILPWCLGLVLPVWFLNTHYARRTLDLSEQLHDELEREVRAIQDGRSSVVRAHYERVAGWRIKLSDSEAINFGLMEIFVLAVLAIALVKSCLLSGAQAGDIFAIFRYVITFIAGLDGVPFLVRQFSRLSDIARRMKGDAGVKE